MANKAKFNVPFKKITFEDMVNHISQNSPSDKKWFKELVDSQPKYNHLKTVRAFCEKYNPSLIPVAKAKKPKKTDMIKDW